MRFGQERFALLFPLGPGGHSWLIWLHGDAHPEREQALAGAREDLGIRHREFAWLSSYRVHHRVAARFRAGPVLLAGDAAHVHSPVGGQDMNTGLQDAHHLANLLATRFGPYAGGLLGQYRIHYHATVEGEPVPRWARDRAVGRRLRPTAENRSALRAMSWQLHLYGAEAERPAVPEWISGPFTFPADPRGRLRADQLYLVRPDGFVAASLPLHAGSVAVADVDAALAAYDVTG